MRTYFVKYSTPFPHFLSVPGKKSMDEIWGWKWIKKFGRQQNLQVQCCCFVSTVVPKTGTCSPSTSVSPSVNLLPMLWSNWVQMAVGSSVLLRKQQFSPFWSPWLFLIQDPYFCHTIKYFLDKSFMQTVKELVFHHCAISETLPLHDKDARESRTQHSHLGNSFSLIYTHQVCWNFSVAQSSRKREERAVLRRVHFHWKGTSALAAVGPLDGGREWPEAAELFPTLTHGPWRWQTNLGSADPAISSLCRLNWLHCSETQSPHPENGHGNTCLSNLSENEKEHTLNTVP